MPNGNMEAVSRCTDNTMAKRWTDNTMAKRCTDNTMPKRKKDKKTNYDLRNTKQKSKEWEKRTYLI